MSEPKLVHKENKKTLVFCEEDDQPLGHVRIAEWMVIEVRTQKLDDEERQVEADARALENHIRELAQTPQHLLLQKSRLEEEALRIRDRREHILRGRQEIDKERKAFWKKNRKETRVSMSVEVSETSEHNFYTGISGNIEDGGLFIATHENHPPGTLIDLTLSLDGHPPLQLVGEVRWLREYNEFTADVEPGLGVGFLRPPVQARRTISDFLKTRPPLLYELD